MNDQSSKDFLVHSSKASTKKTPSPTLGLDWEESPSIQWGKATQSRPAITLVINRSSSSPGNKSSRKNTMVLDTDIKPSRCSNSIRRKKTK